MIKRYLLLFTITLFSCSKEEPSFVESSHSDDAVIVGKPLWQDTSQQVNLVVRAVDFGGMGHVSWLSLEKYLSNGDTLVYRLSNMGLFDRNKDYKKFNVFADTLYLYDKEFKNVVFPRLSKNDSSGLEIEDSIIISQYHIDTLKIKKLYNGIYRWKDNDFVLVDRNPNNYISSYLTINKQGEIGYQGVVYLAPPGAGVKHKYSLKTITNKLSKVNSTWLAPGKLE